MTMWLIWIIVGVVCLILEILTPTFFFISFGISAILVGLLSIIFKNILFQIVLFSIVSIAIFYLFKKISPRIFRSNKTNVYALIGKGCIVSKTINPDAIGRVKIESEEWSAVSNQKIKKGSKAIVEKVYGNKVIVKKNRS